MIGKTRMTRKEYQMRYTLKRWGTVEAFKKWKSEQAAAEIGVKRRKLLLYKYAKGCAKCGEPRPWVLDCHHRDPSTKTRNVSAMVSQYGWARILEEVDKCDILCKNCHYQYHWLERHPDWPTEYPEIVL